MEKMRSDNMDRLEIKRQLFHLISGIIAGILVWLKILNWQMLLAIAAIGAILCILSKRYRIPGVYWFLKNFSRAEELKTFPGRGPLTFVIGILLSVVLFRLDVATAAIMTLAIGDSISHLVGKYFGRMPHPFTNKKYLEGAAAGIILGFIGAAFFVRPAYAFLGALIAMIVEGIEMQTSRFRIDDNITVPLAAGIVITFCAILFG